MKTHLIKTRLANAIAVEYDSGLFIVDVAVQCHRTVLGYVEQTLERPITDIKLVVCTHDDPDHMGGIFALAGLCGARIAAPFASGLPARKFLNDPFGAFFRAGTGFAEAFRPRMWNMYANSQRSKSASDLPQYVGDEGKVKLSEDDIRRLKNNDLMPGFNDWRVVHTPGHSWDSCCYYHKKTGTLITGDTLLGSRKKAKVVLPAIYANRLHFSQSLAKLKELDIQAVYPGHGGVIEGGDLLRGLN
jgi:glyoxylase-like metal-dependent hydrolase (beta-lactamase superfamily II)